MAFDKIEHEVGGAPKMTTTTRWAVVREAACGSHAALTSLCKKYRYPAYVFFRRSEGNAEVAADLTQGFFVKFLENNYAADADEARGRFRAFLHTSMSNYLSNERDRRRTIKNGREQSFVSLDHASDEERYRIEPRHNLTPEVLYERSFAIALLEQGLSTVRARYEKEGKHRVFEALKGFLDGSDSRPYAEVAAQLGWTPENVRVAVHRLRKRHGEVLRHAIAETVVNPDDASDERRHLIDVLRAPR